MRSKHATLLLIDGIINLVLGALLLLYPLGSARFLGVPASDSSFYPTLLGAVIFGIGVALLTERYGFSQGIRGLGLAGAIAINLIGGGCLLIWLLMVPLELPAHGLALLWTVAVLVLMVGIVELMAGAWKY